MGSQDVIVINGNELPFYSDETILNVAKRNHIDIPTLCHLKDTTPTGTCKICVVEIKGEDDLFCACSTAAENNMIVETESPKVVEKRRSIIETYLSSGNHNCAIRGSNSNNWIEFQLKVHKEDGSSELCPRWGDCELQDLAYRYQVSGESFTTKETIYPMERVNPFIIRDFARCILCGRCVKACNEVQVNNAIDFGNGGFSDKIITPNDKPLKDSDCVFCGECIQACPVGALVEKDTRYHARPWETKKVLTTCSYCGVGCQLFLHVKENRVVKVTGANRAPNYGSLCVKGRFGFDFIHSKERLRKPLIKENGKFREAQWDEALNLIARRLNEILNQHEVDSIGLLTSARMTNEDNYIAQKFARAVLKTNNVDHCARL